MLLNESNEREATEHLKAVGGVTKIVKHPFATKDLLYTILDVLTTQKKVEETFRALTKRKIISSKYPYMPIFDNSAPDAASLPEPEHKDIERAVRKTIRSVDHESIRSGYTMSGSFASGHEQRVEEVEEGTDCSSLLPEFVKRIRKEQPELNSPYRQERLRHASNAEELEDERMQSEAAERLAWRARLASRDAGQDEGSIDSSIGEKGQDIPAVDDVVVAHG